MKFLILIFLFVSQAAFAQMKEYRCQLATMDCEFGGGRYGVYVGADNIKVAKEICKYEASARKEVFCQVGSTDKEPARKYRCQMAKEFCGENGGRYGKLLKALNRADAEQKCAQLAYKLNEPLCQVD